MPFADLLTVPKLSYVIWDTPGLNARVDDEVVQKVELIKSRDSASTTEILKAAIEHYFEARNLPQDVA